MNCASVSCGDCGASFPGLAPPHARQPSATSTVSRGLTDDTSSGGGVNRRRSEEHTSELQSQSNLVCRLLLEKKKKKTTQQLTHTTRPQPTNHTRGGSLYRVVM